MSSSSSLLKMASDRAWSSEELRGTAMPPTGYHLLGWPVESTVRMSTMYSGAPPALSFSKFSAALSRFAATADFGFSALAFSFSSFAEGLPKPLACMATPMLLALLLGRLLLPSRLGVGTNAAESSIAQAQTASIAAWTYGRGPREMQDLSLAGPGGGVGW